MTLESGTFQPTTCDSPAQSATYCFCLLGGLVISYEGQPVDRPPFCIYSLLAALLFHPGAQRREFLIGYLYPDLPERTRRKRLCDLVSLLFASQVPLYYGVLCCLRIVGLRYETQPMLLAFQVEPYGESVGGNYLFGCG